jgi:hypothetical protein
MSAKSRQVIYGGRIIGAKIRAEGAREAAKKAVREAERAEAEAQSIQMEGYGGPAQPSPTIGQCLNGGYTRTVSRSVFEFESVAVGDAINAVLADARYNFRRLLRWLRFLLFRILVALDLIAQLKLA